MFTCPAGGESQGGATEVSGRPARHLEAEEGLYLPEPDRASLHDSEGLCVDRKQCSSFSVTISVAQICFGSENQKSEMTKTSTCDS